LLALADSPAKEHTMSSRPLSADALMLGRQR
jgi:hypothetical protein